MTKEELINFIKYLRSKEKIVVERIIEWKIRSFLQAKSVQRISGP